MSTTYKLQANTNPLNKNIMVCVLSSDNLMTTTDNLYAKNRTEVFGKEMM